MAKIDPKAQEPVHKPDKRLTRVADLLSDHALLAKSAKILWKLKSYFSRVGKNNQAVLEVPLQAPPQVPCQTFTCFPRLPAELQLMVWHAALPGPRKISTLSPDPGPLNLQMREGQRVLKALYSTCWDSHMEVKKNYQIQPHPSMGRLIWFNPDIDTVQLYTILMGCVFDETYGPAYVEGLSIKQTGIKRLFLKPRFYEGLFRTMKHVELAGWEHIMTEDALASGILKVIMRSPNLETLVYPRGTALDQEDFQEMLKDAFYRNDLDNSNPQYHIQGERFFNTPACKVIADIDAKALAIWKATPSWLR